MAIIRRSKAIHGFIGPYNYDTAAKPSYRVDILYKCLFGTFLIRRYYMVCQVFRTVGMYESKASLPSTPFQYGKATIKHQFQNKIQPKSLRPIYSGFSE